MTPHHVTHPGESIRGRIEESGLTVTELADRLEMGRGTLQRLLSGRIAVTARAALALEAIGWSNAEFRLRLQNQFDLACERRRQTAA